jgi:hypothetical protein
MVLLMLGLIVQKISFFAQLSISISNKQLTFIAKKFGLVLCHKMWAKDFRIDKTAISF